MPKQGALYSTPVKLIILLVFVAIIATSIYMRFSIRDTLRERDAAAPPAASQPDEAPAEAK